MEEQLLWNSLNDQDREETEAMSYRKNETIGDTMNREKEDNATRMFSQNMNGMNLENNGGDCKDLCEEMVGCQVELICIQEHKNDHKNEKVQEIIREAVRKHFDHK